MQGKSRYKYFSNKNTFMRLSKSRKPKNEFLVNLKYYSTLYDFYFESYDQNQMSKNITLLHFVRSVTAIRQ